MDSDFKLLFFGGSRSSSPLALVLEVEGPEGLLKKEDIFDIFKENVNSKTTTLECACVAQSLGAIPLASG